LPVKVQPSFSSKFRSARRKPVLLPGLPADSSRIGAPSDIASRNLLEVCAQFACARTTCLPDRKDENSTEPSERTCNTRSSRLLACLLLVPSDAEAIIALLEKLDWKKEQGGKSPFLFPSPVKADQPICKNIEKANEKVYGKSKVLHFYDSQCPADERPELAVAK